MDLEHRIRLLTKEDTRLIEAENGAYPQYRNPFRRLISHSHAIWSLSQYLRWQLRLAVEAIVDQKLDQRKSAYQETFEDLEVTLGTRQELEKAFQQYGKSSPKATSTPVEIVPYYLTFEGLSTDGTVVFLRQLALTVSQVATLKSLAGEDIKVSCNSVTPLGTLAEVVMFGTLILKEGTRQNSSPLPTREVSGVVGKGLEIMGGEVKIEDFKKTLCAHFWVQTLDGKKRFCHYCNVDYLPKSEEGRNG